MPQYYQPGERKKKFGQNYQLTEDRYAWVTVEVGKFLILVGEDTGSGPDVVLFHPRSGRIPDVAWNLSNLTEAELNALEDLVTTAFEWARTVVQRRDKEAQDAWDQGDDSHSRNYRAVPQLVYRKRPEWEHSEGVQQRPSGVSEGSGGEWSGNDRRVRGAGDELAQPDSEHSVSQDDQSEANEPERLRSMDGDS